MALDTTTTAAPSNSTAALTQGWINDLHNALVSTSPASGWTQTSDTGQTTMPYAGAAPGAVNTVVAKAVYQMTGSPSVYLILEYGSGGNINTPCVWVQVVSATNGASAPHASAQATTRKQIITANLNEATPRSCKHSLDTDRCAFLMFYDSANANQAFWFGVERIRDTNGDISDGSSSRQGVYLVGSGGSGSTFSQPLELGVTQAAPTMQAGVAAAFGIGAPTNIGTLYNNNAALLEMNLYLGERLSAPTIFQGYILSDIPVAGTIVAKVYGTNRNYFALGAPVAMPSIQTSPQNILLAMRYGG